MVSLGGFNFGGLGGIAFQWLSSLMFWGIVLVVILVIGFFLIVYKKQRKLNLPLIELTDLGNGKMGIEAFLHRGAGWFKSRQMFFGLFESGEDVLKHRDGRVIQGGSSETFHDINGKRGLVVMRKQDDPAILLPISRMKCINKYLMTQIAPADYRDASVKIIRSTEKETMGKLEKIAPYIAIGLVAIVFLICIILIVQMVKQGQAEAKDTILEAGKIVAEASRNTVASGAP